MNYRDMMDAERRLVILQALQQAPGYALRETVLMRLLQGERLAVSRDALRAELAWLADRGLLAVEYHDDVQAARITTRGADVAQGLTLVDGIARPGP